MKLHLSRPAGQNAITGYGIDYVDVNGERHSRSLVLLPDRVITDWPPQSMAALAAEHFDLLLEARPEIVLLGTGRQLRFPRSTVTRPLIEAHIGLEVMDVRAACRTYNILMGEDRKVAAALVIEA